MWGESNYLELNVKKTKEMIVDFRRTHCDHEPLVINNVAVDVVESYKYLGTMIDDKFTFNQHAENVFKKSNSRMYCLRQLKKLDVDNKIVQLFFTSVVQSVINFSISCWYGNCSVEAKDKLARILRNCEKLGVQHVNSLSENFKKCAMHRCVIVCKDKQHPLNCNYKMLPSGRRLRSMKCRTTRYAKSFVPSIITLNNNNTERVLKYVIKALCE